jgi:hypothetical protein
VYMCIFKVPPVNNAVDSVNENESLLTEYLIFIPSYSLCLFFTMNLRRGKGGYNKPVPGRSSARCKLSSIASLYSAHMSVQKYG